MEHQKFQRVILVFVLLVGGLAMAQVTTGTISGTVKDGSGAVLPGTKVLLLNQETGISRTVQTDTSGHYSAPSLGLGNYQVTASLEGFNTEVRRGIALTVGREAVVDMVLSVGAVTQTVEVTGEAPLVESTTSSLGSLVDDRTIRDLPLNGRSYDQLALLQPGVIVMGGGTAEGGFGYGSGKRFSVSGSRSDSNSFLLDGTDIEDQGNGTPGGAAGNNLGVDTIREFKILTNSFSAEYGRSSGAVITSVTRSGTNTFHGSIFEFIRNSHLDARNFFDVGTSPPSFKRNQFGGVAGGPIKKDKTFFFAGYEGLRQGLGTTLISTVPTISSKQGILPGGVVVPVNPSISPYLTALFPAPNGRDFGDGTAQFIYAPNVISNEDSFMGRVDHQLNAKTSLFGRYSYDGDSVYSPDLNYGFATNNTSRRQYSTIQANSILSPTVLNNARFAYNRTFQTTDDQPTISIPSQLSFSPGLPIGTINVGGPSIGGTAATSRVLTTTGTSYSAPRSYGYNLFEWGDDFSVIKGKHSLKAGVDIERMRDNTAQNTGLRGQYTFPSFNTFLAGQPSNLVIVPAGEDAYRGFRQTFGALYIQDDINATSRLTLNVGLRWEATTDPTEVNGKVSNLLTTLSPSLSLLGHFMSITKKNFEPRVGFAWRLNDSGKTVLRAGGGIFHNLILPYVYALNVAKLPPFYTLATINNPIFPNGYSQVGTSVALPQLQMPAPHAKELAKYQYNVSIEQQLFKDTVLELSYIGSKANHIMQFIEANTPYPTILPNGEEFYPAGAPRRNPNFTTIHWMTSDGNAIYNAATITLKRKSSNGLLYQVFYTFSKAMDSISGTAGGDTLRDGSFIMDPNNPGRDWGRSDFNAKHNFVFNFTYPLPLQFKSRALESALGGWSINGIGTFTSGQPFTTRLLNNNSRDLDGQNVDRPDLKPGANSNPVQGGATQYYNPNSFSLPMPGTYGNLGRNTLVGPGIASLDTSVEKSFKVRESTDVVFRAEFFNVINHANFGLPNTSPLATSGAINGSAGVISNTVTSSRQIQFGLKINF